MLDELGRRSSLEKKCPKCGYRLDPVKTVKMTRWVCMNRYCNYQKDLYHKKEG